MPKQALLGQMSATDDWSGSYKIPWVMDDIPELFSVLNVLVHVRMNIVSAECLEK